MTTNSTTGINPSYDESDSENGQNDDRKWYHPLVPITDTELLAQIEAHPATDSVESAMCGTLQDLLQQMDLTCYYGVSPVRTNSSDIARKRAAEFVFGEFLKSRMLNGKKLIAEVQTLTVTYQNCTCFNYNPYLDECSYESYGGHYTTEWTHMLFTQVASLDEVRKLAELHDPEAENSYDPCGERVFFTIMPA